MTTGAGRGQTARPARVHLTLAVCGGLLAAAGLTACSGDDADTSDTRGETSTSPSASPTPSATPAAAPARTTPLPVPKRPRAAAGPAGQRAFTRYVIAAWSSALDSNDADRLVSLSPAGVPCQGCAALTASLAKRRAQDWSVDFTGLRVRSVRLTQQGPGQVYAKATVDVPRSDSFFDDGSYRNTSRAHRGASFEVLMRYAAGKYSLLAFTLS